MHSYSIDLTAFTESVKWRTRPCPSTEMPLYRQSCAVAKRPRPKQFTCAADGLLTMYHYLFGGGFMAMAQVIAVLMLRLMAAFAVFSQLLLVLQNAGYCLTNALGNSMNTTFVLVVLRNEITLTPEPHQFLIIRNHPHLPSPSCF